MTLETYDVLSFPQIASTKSLLLYLECLSRIYNAFTYLSMKVINFCDLLIYKVGKGRILITFCLHNGDTESCFNLTTYDII